VRQEVETGRTSPLIPIIAETMARVLARVKFAPKKIGTERPRLASDDDWQSTYGF
jgi:hypothetical protein